MMGNVSAGISGYESPATTKSMFSNSDWISARYGCNHKTEHHMNTRCKLQGRIDQLKKRILQTSDPMEVVKLKTQLFKWSMKLKDELRRSRFRKD